ncbi:hypothetical protein EN749_27515 [Mesorhizobium sp. M7A.F.Ca.ET.027.02.1.1]|uniref:hypothetical protein n=1 Tax=Mesorhizobium sp. M7A.F.Ca.ET.027.02.1.1 TaxID=2496655 RepID=UPI000FD3AC83|nr:hypothetical protein [Mesorhizobium sp. M7A.F.Ca.ET.027.02.1.1]RVD12444.1 hypothetical protein EN749_27515 [Mesorhizobium sp. M7A.F.Ca.ET.027.02.1.1]RWC23871.1 MAG: hypothetical protein EOS27_31445 [Mesorhizobium sp.]
MKEIRETGLETKPDWRVDDPSKPVLNGGSLKEIHEKRRKTTSAGRPTLVVTNVGPAPVLVPLNGFAVLH